MNEAEFTNPYKAKIALIEASVTDEEHTYGSAVNHVGDEAREYTTFGDTVFYHWKQYAWQEGYDYRAEDVAKLRASLVAAQEEVAVLKLALELLHEWLGDYYQEDYIASAILVRKAMHQARQELAKENDG